MPALRGFGGSFSGWVDGWRGTLQRGAVRASVRLEPPGWLRVCQPVADARAAELLFAASRSWPLDVRCGGPPAARVLLADTWIERETQHEGETHLARTIEEILLGFEAGLRATSAAPARAGRVRPSAPARAVDGVVALDESPVAPATVETAIAALGWDPAAVVRLQGQSAWELRPRLEGAPQAVRLELAGARLLLQRTLAKPEQVERLSARRRQALAELALRLHPSFRRARLVHAPEGLRVEASLHAGELAPAGLARAVRAVAAAGIHARLPLALILEHERVAEAYAAAFCVAHDLTAHHPPLSE